MKLHRWIACAALAGATAWTPASAQGTGLTQAVEAAWQRALQSQQALGRERVALARQAAAGSLMPAAPALELSHREGRDTSGAQETELGVALPLWMPGRRIAHQAAAEAELAAARAAHQLGRLRVAEEVREAAWNLAAHQGELALAQAEMGLLRSLSDDVERRVRAGDLARADALAARAELLSAQAQAADAQQRLQAAEARWTTLTGVAPLSDPSEPSSESATAGEHPELVLARLEQDRARRQLDALRHSRRDPPELTVGWKQERAASAQPRENSVGIAFRIPFGNDPRSGPQEAQALAELEAAQHTAQRLAERLAIDQRTAHSAVSNAEQQFQTEQSRAALLRERAQLLDKSFRAGETPLPDVLRASAAAAQAEAAATRQRVALGLARARLHQSLGLMP